MKTEDKHFVTTNEGINPCLIVYFNETDYLKINLN